MSSISNIIDEGKELLRKMSLVGKTPFFYPFQIPSAQIQQAYSIHTRGKFAILRVDKHTQQTYDGLFAKSRDLFGTNLNAWNYYVKSELEKCIGILDAIERGGTEALDKSTVRVFISHGKFTPAFSKTEVFLQALRCKPIFDTSEPTAGRTINQHVEKLFSEADFNIILATGETKSEKGETLPNHNVIIEYDRLLKDKPGEMIVLLESGVKMPTMVQDVIYTSFSQNCMDEAFTKLVRELAQRGLLRS